MKRVIIQLVLALCIVGLVAGGAQAAPAPAPAYAYHEECDNEGCDNHEIAELYDSFQNECFVEGCAYEEVRELAGGTAHVDAMYGAFRTRLGKVFTDPFTGVGPYQGVFQGAATGHGGSNATITLDLTHQGNAVSGIATIGDGLQVDTGGGFCPGVVSIPARTVNVSGSTNTNNPNHLTVSASIDVSGHTVDIEVGADLSTDGQAMNAQIKLDVPWPCDDATLTATLGKA